MTKSIRDIISINLSMKILFLMLWLLVRKNRSKNTASMMATINTQIRAQMMKNDEWEDGKDSIEFDDWIN